MDIIKILENILRDKYQINSILNNNTHLINEFGFESISLVELSSELGKKINKDIPISEAAKWTTVESILELVRNEKMVKTG